MSNHGIIPAQETTCILDIHVSEVDCSPSKNLAEQVMSGSGDITFDPAVFAKSNYTVLTLSYESPERVSGFQCEIEIPPGHTHIVAVGTKKGEDDTSTDTALRNFFVFHAKNTVYGVINPERSGATTGTGLNLNTAAVGVPKKLCYVVLAKSKFYTDAMCPSTVNVKSFKATTNLRTGSTSILTQPAPTWTGTINSATIGSSNLYHIANLAATKTYHINLDINNDGNRILDILDITALANKIHNLNWDPSDTNIKPEYICRDQEDFIVNSDLPAEIEIMSVNISLNNNDSNLHDLVVEFGLRSSNSTAGLDFVFGRDIFDSLEGSEKIEFIGPLKNLENTWGYKFVSIRNRFNRDITTRIMAYQMPYDANDVQVQNDFTTAEGMLKINSLGVLTELLPIIKYTLTGCKLEAGGMPERRYYYASNLSLDTHGQQEIKTANQKNARYYGPVNEINGVYYTGKVYNPNSSRRLIIKWDAFELFNEKVVTNDFLNYLSHTDHGLKYAGFDLIYNPDSTKLLTYFENKIEDYYKYLINYLYNPLNKGLNTLLAEYNCEPSGSDNPLHNGYISDADLSGYHDIVDLVSLSNLGTQKLSTTETSTLTFLQELSRNEKHLSFHDTIDSSTSTIVVDDDLETRVARKSLKKVVPTAILRNFTTTTLPHILPSIRGQGNSANIFFSEVVNVNQDRWYNANHDLPAEFKNWSEYFSDLHNIKYYEIPPAIRNSFIEIKLATNTPDINFITSAEFILDFSNTYTSLSSREFWIYPGDGFATGSYSFTIRADSNSGSILNPTGSEIPSTSGKFHVKLDITGSTTLATPITYDGGALTLAKLFIESESSSAQIKWAEGKYVSFTTTPNTGSIESVGKPLHRSGSINYLKYTNDNRLVYGPSASYMTLTGSNPDNSASPRHYGDSLLRLRAITPSTFNIEYDTLKCFNTASFDIKVINNIEVDSINKNFYYPSITDYTASFDTGSINDGITTIQISSSLYLSGSKELLRFKTKRQIFSNAILQEDKEFITPPKGKNLDLVVPNIDKTFIFPTTDNIRFHIDPSESKWVRTILSGSQSVVKTLANPYAYWNFEQSTDAKMPIYTNSSSAFTTDMYYLSFPDSGSLTSMATDYDIGQAIQEDIQQITFIGVFEPLTLSGSFNKIIYKATSSVNTLQIGLRGQSDRASEGSVYITTSGSEGGSYAFDAAFSDVIGNTTNLGIDGHVLVVTSDGTDTSTSATNVWLNGTFITSSLSALSSSGYGYLNYSLGGKGAAEASYYEGNIGEIIVFNSILPSSSIEIFEGYAAHKWGLSSKLPSDHKYKSTKPNVSNTTINNSASKAAIQAYDNYVPGHAAASDRASSRILSKYIVLDNIVITSGSTALSNPDYDLFREIPKSLRQSSAGEGDAEIFIDSWNAATGKLKLSYKSRRKVDGYQIELGNSRPSSSLDRLVGIIQVDKEEELSETAKKEWKEYIGFNSDASEVYNRDPQVVNSPYLIAFGFSDGPVEKTNGKEQDNYNLSSWALPATTDGETKPLTVLNVDPSSFFGHRPTLKSFSLFTNDDAIVPTSSWSGSSDGGTIGFSDLSEAIQLVQYGFINSSSSDSTISANGLTYDASGSRGNLKVDSVLAIWNHLVIKNGEAAKDITQKIVPRNCSDFIVNPPGIPTVTATTGSLECTAALSASISWTTASGGGVAYGYEIWRTANVNAPDGSTYLWNPDRMNLNQSTAPYQYLATIHTGSTQTFIDLNPPKNEDCCSSTDNPQIEYLIIAFGFGGESAGISSPIQLPCCNTAPTVSDIIITSSINTWIPFNINATLSTATGPFGETQASVKTPDSLIFNIIDYDNGSVREVAGASGKFEFKAPHNFVGKTQLTYQVSTRAGCNSTGSAYFAIRPSKFTPEISLINPLGRNDTNIKVKLKWERSDVEGNILRYEVFKINSGSAYGVDPSASIPGDFLVGEETVRYYDSFVPPTEELKFKYKVKAFGFSGDVENACEEDRCISVETDDLYVTIPARITGSNPVVTISSSQCVDADHPLVKLTWASGSTDSLTEVQYYNIYRTGRSNDIYTFHGSLNFTAVGANYTYYDRVLPQLTGENHCEEEYVIKYRVTSVSDDGENGDPNSGWTADVLYTPTASISGSSNIPIAESRTLEGVCEGLTLTGDVSPFVYNNDPAVTTFEFEDIGVKLTGSAITGIFTYDSTTAGTREFDYSVTSGNKTSVSGTITFPIYDCTDLATPPGLEASHTITNIYDVQGEQTKTVDQVPFSLREPGGQGIRKKSIPYSTSKGEIKSEDE